MTIKNLEQNEYSPYFKRYLDKLSPELNLKEAYLENNQLFEKFFEQIPDDKLQYSYEPGKWTVKQVYQHVIDTERIFAYRIFRMGRKDKTPLANFDQEIYNDPSGASHKSRAQLNEEYRVTRSNTSVIINSLTDEQLCFIGTSGDAPISARAAAFIALGHEIWHMDIIRERYL